MRLASRLIVLQVGLCLAGSVPAFAGAKAVFGDSWSTPANRLQSIVDATYGPGRIDVRADYLGARPGDPDQIAWTTSLFPIMQLREIAGGSRRADFGWYLESGDGRPPVIDGIDDRPAFQAGHAEPTTTVLLLRNRERTVGFYLRSPDAGSGLGPRTFFTNRSFNDVGPGGAGALHEPAFGGDIQALVFDVSAWTRPFTWLVCFESRDSGGLPGPCCGATDNDYADYVIEVRAEATTAAQAPSFGTLKSLYHD